MTANTSVAAPQQQDNRSILANLLKTGTPSKIIASPAVSDRFQHLYSLIHHVSKDRAAAFYQAEQFHFLKLINDAPDTVGKCTKLSLYGVFMDVAVSGLSFDPSMKHLYVVPYNVNIGTKDNKIWEKRASLQISGQGELLLRTLQGQIKYADNPVLVYEGDDFKFGTWDDKVRLEHMAAFPKKSNKIMAAYMKITRTDGVVDYKVMTNEEVQNLRKFSKDPNSKAWTDGFAGMMTAKLIKHAFKNYPKMRIGEFSQVESETVDAVPELDYGIDEYDQPAIQAASIDQAAGGQFTAAEVVTDPAPVQNDNPTQSAATSTQFSPNNDIDEAF